jgi:hypothetical protein
MLYMVVNDKMDRIYAMYSDLKKALEFINKLYLAGVYAGLYSASLIAVS